MYLVAPAWSSQRDHSERFLVAGPGHFRLYPRETAYIYQSDFNCLTRNGLALDVYPIVCRFSLLVRTQKPCWADETELADLLASIPLGLEGNDAQLERDVFNNLRREFELAVRKSPALYAIIGQTNQLLEAAPQYSAQAKTDLLTGRARIKQAVAQLNDELHYQTSFGNYELRSGLYRVEFYLESVALAPNIEAELSKFETRIREIEQESRQHYQQNYENMLKALNQTRKFLEIEGLPTEQKVALMEQANHLIAALKELVKSEASNHLAAPPNTPGFNAPTNAGLSMPRMKVVGGPQFIDMPDSNHQ